MGKNKNKKQGNQSEQPLNRKIRMLWVSDFDGTGYSTASINLIKGMQLNSEFKEKVDLHLYVVNTVKPIEYHRDNLPKNHLIGFPADHIHCGKVVSIMLQKGPDNLETEDLKAMARRSLYGITELPELLNEHDFDVVFIINDNAYVELVGKAVLKTYEKKPEKRPRIIGYMPVDCHNFPVDFFKNVDDVVDSLITMNKFSKHEIVKTEFKKNIEILPHPIDSDVFYPMSKLEARKQILGDENPNAFLILNNNNNQSRKRLDITIEAFAKFLERNPTANAYLILKSLKSSLNDKGKDINEMIATIAKDLKQRGVPVDFTSRVIVFSRLFTTKELNYLYNMVDLNINTCSGEGWGLIPCEVSLCGVPQIVPDNTAHPEIFKSVRMIKCDEIPWLKGRMFMDENPHGIMIYMQGYRDVIDPGVNQTDASRIKLFEGHGLTILLAPEGNSDPDKPVSGSLGNMKLDYVFNTPNAIGKVVRKLNPPYFQVLVKYGEEYNYIYNMNKEYECKIDGYKINKVSNKEIQDLHNGFKIKVKTPITEDASQLIEYYYKNPEKCLEVGEKCRRIMLDDFNVEKCGNILIDIFKKEKIIR